MRALLTQKSCAVGMRNAKPGNVIIIILIIIIIIIIIIILIKIIIIIIIISNSNWTEWNTIQGVIERIISKSDEREAYLKLRARLPPELYVNCT